MFVKIIFKNWNKSFWQLKLNISCSILHIEYFLHVKLWLIDFLHVQVENLLLGFFVIGDRVAKLVNVSESWITLFTVFPSFSNILNSNIYSKKDWCWVLSGEYHNLYIVEIRYQYLYLLVFNIYIILHMVLNTCRSPSYSSQLIVSHE